MVNIYCRITSELLYSLNCYFINFTNALVLWKHWRLWKCKVVYSQNIKIVSYLINDMIGGNVAWTYVSTDIIALKAM